MNPYDRRVQARRAREYQGDAVQAFGGPFLRGGLVDTPRESPITMNELEAMVHQAKHRGRREVLDTVPQQLHDARRAAWEEGHEAGSEAGRGALLRAIDGRVGETVRAAHERAAKLLLAHQDDARKVTKDELVEALSYANGVLADAIYQHHNGFVDLPF